MTDAVEYMNRANPAPPLHPAKRETMTTIQVCEKVTTEKQVHLMRPRKDTSGQYDANTTLKRLSRARNAGRKRSTSSSLILRRRAMTDRKIPAIAKPDITGHTIIGKSLSIPVVVALCALLEVRRGVALRRLESGIQADHPMKLTNAQADELDQEIIRHIDATRADERRKVAEEIESLCRDMYLYTGVDIADQIRAEYLQDKPAPEGGK